MSENTLFSHFLARKELYLSCKRAIGGGGRGGGSRGHPLIANYFHFLRTTFLNDFKVMRFFGLFLCNFLAESAVTSFQRLLLTTIEL